MCFGGCLLDSYESLFSKIWVPSVLMCHLCSLSNVFWAHQNQQVKQLKGINCRRFLWNLVYILKSTFLFLSGQESRPKNMDQRELVAQQKIHTDANSHLNIPDFNRQTSHHSLAKARCDPFLSNPGFMSSKCSFSSEVSFPNSSEISSQCLNTTIFSDCIHKLIRLGGKQRPCALCKHFCKKTPCGDNIRTYYKCEKCDVPLCKGPIRNCFKEFHEHLGTTREYVVLENTTHTKWCVSPTWCREVSVMDLHESENCCLNGTLLLLKCFWQCFRWESMQTVRLTVQTENVSWWVTESFFFSLQMANQWS